MNKDRRNFIKQSCGLCTSLLGIGMVLPAIEACSTLLTLKTNVTKGTIQLAKSNFTLENPIVIVRNEAQEFDIAVVKLDENKFKAFEMQCTHQSNAIIPTKKGFFCNAHGSSFSFDGKVQKPPAQYNLKEYTTEETQELITVRL